MKPFFLQPFILTNKNIYFEVDVQSIYLTEVSKVINVLILDRCKFIKESKIRKIFVWIKFMLKQFRQTILLKIMENFIFF